MHPQGLIIFEFPLKMISKNDILSFIYFCRLSSRLIAEKNASDNAKVAEW